MTREPRALADQGAVLRASEETFHHLIDAVTDYAIFLLDTEGRVVTWNPGAESIKGYRAEEIVGHHVSTFYTAEDVASGKVDAILETVRRTGRFEEEGLRVRKNGESFWASVVITRLRDGEGRVTGFAKVTRDLTERRGVEETARRLFREQTARAAAEDVARQALEASRIKDEFLATVSHELRTPLNAIVGWVSVLRGEDLPAAARHAVDVIERNARAQTLIVDDILDVSSIIKGKFLVETDAVDLTSLVRAAVEVVSVAAGAKDIALRVHLPQDAPMIGDAARLQQVAWNLVSNAVKFTEPGGTVDVELHQHEHEHELHLRVRDTGIGIDSSFLPFAFDRFRQADNTSTRRVGGLGLGLAVVRHIVELHGGTVSATSEGAGRGSTFDVRLPVRVASSAARRALLESSRPLAPRDEMAAVKASQPPLLDVELLVVDDDEDARDLMAEILSSYGARVDTASSAAEGLAAVRARPPQAIVSDIGMPGEDGYGFMRKVRALTEEEGGNVPAIALTAYTRPEDRANALASGFDAHLHKPLDPQAVVATLVKLVSSARG